MKWPLAAKRFAASGVRNNLMSLSIDDDDVVVATAVAEPADPLFTAAAEVLERAVQAGFTDPNVLYLLALASKRQATLPEARTPLPKTHHPDTTPLLQLASLPLRSHL